jgi:hypothetical protein
VTAWALRLAALWLALIWSADVLAHGTTTALVRIELLDNRLQYALSIALPEIPIESVALLTSAAGGDRLAAERIAEYAKKTVTVELGNSRCRMGRLRIGGAGANDPCRDRDRLYMRLSAWPP